VILRRPLATQAIIEHAEYIGKHSPASADRLINAAEATFAQLQRMPGMGYRYESPEPRLVGVRVWSIKGFPQPFDLFDGGIEVLHIVHGARDIQTVLNDAIHKRE
jgi:toxin ParE1/3/4